MLLSDYIQWYLTDEEMKDVSEPFIQYSKSKQGALNRLSFNSYSNAIKKRFHNNDQEITNYFNAASALVNNQGFQTALDNAMNALQMPEYTNRSVFALQGVFMKDAEKYQQLVSQVNNALTSIISLLGVANLDSVLPGETMTAIQNLYNDQTQYDKVIQIEQYEQMSAQFKGQYKSLLNLIPDFQAELATGKCSQNSLIIISKILAPIQRLIGICSEFQIELETNKLLDDMCKQLNNPNLTVTRTGDESSVKGGFRIGTADLSFNLGQGSSNLNFNIPDLGVSLKRSHKNLNSTKSVNIKLKGTTIGALMNELDPRLVTAFYTLYANTQPTIGEQTQKALPAGALTGAYKRMKAECLVPALIGNLNAQELVTIFVINNQAYTIFDLLDRISNSINADENVMTMSPAFSSLHKSVVDTHNSLFNPDGDKFARSNAIRSYINSISSSITLKLQTDALK